MTSDDQRLIRIAQQQEAGIAGINGLADILEIHTEMLKVIGERQIDLKGWLEEPPKSDLPDLLKHWTAEIVGMRTEIGEMRAAISEMRAAIAHAVTDEEVPS